MKSIPVARSRRRCPDLTPVTRVLSVLIPLLFLVAPAVLRGQSEDARISGSALGKRLDLLVNDSSLAGSFVGIRVVGLETGVTMYQKNAGKLFHPASNMKLLTTAAALAALPPGYLFRTSLYCDGAISDSVLEGNLYVRAGGDPLLEIADLDSIAGIVLAAGIRKIRGGIVGDVTSFDTLRWGKGWMWDDEPNPEEAFITPLVLHGNCVTLTFTPGTNPGDTLAYDLEPAGTPVTVENGALTLPPGVRDTLIATRIPGTNRIILGGGLSTDAAPRERSLSVHKPEWLFLEVLRQRLALRGIATDRPVGLGSTRGPVHLGTIAHTLDTVMTRINKESDNLSAEILLKHLGSRHDGVPGTARAGLLAVGEYLASIGTDPSTIILADGSGVSWYNAVTPDLIISVLRDQYRRQNTFGLFRGTLPVSGYDGTLENRFTHSPARGRVFAKTGTITGVSTLSGYLYTAGHELLAFSIMVNHHPGRSRRLREFQEAFLEELVSLPPSAPRK